MAPGDINGRELAEYLTISQKQFGEVTKLRGWLTETLYSTVLPIVDCIWYEPHCSFCKRLVVSCNCLACEHTDAILKEMGLWGHPSISWRLLPLKDYTHGGLLCCAPSTSELKDICPMSWSLALTQIPGHCTNHRLLSTLVHEWLWWSNVHMVTPMGEYESC